MAGLFKTLFGRSVRLPAPSEQDWLEALELPVFQGLSAGEQETLRRLAERLLADKAFTPVSGAEPGGRELAAIASQAVLPILHLGYDWYAGWNEVIIYPQQFVPERDVTDAFGLVHRVRQPLSGEAWKGGPLILSLDDVAWSGRCQGYNVVIHEFAHKLDMKNGAVDGLPPLHGDMSPSDWASVFKSAYAAFCRQVDGGREAGIDPYAAESPAEFFAVLTEYFFEWPEAVKRAFPAVYHQLALFYRQDPLARLEYPNHDPATP
jgi:Mlc titration factor MtfA (ptsG expression regulator)